MIRLTVLKIRSSEQSDCSYLFHDLSQSLMARLSVRSKMLPMPSSHHSSGSACAWFIHGAAKNPDLCSTVIRPDMFTEDEFNAYLGELAENYAWALLPWGAPATSRFLALVTTDAEHQRMLEGEICGIPGISIRSRISESSELVGAARTIMYFEEYDSKSTGIWQQAKLDQVEPFVLYAPPVRFDPSGTPSLDISKEIVGGTSYQATFRDKYTRNERTYPFAYRLYRVTNEAGLRAICRGHGKRALVFGGKCCQDGLRQILTPDRSFYEDEFEVLSELSVAAEWAYGVNCGCQDWPVDVFTSENLLSTQTVKGVLQTKHTPFSFFSFC